VVEVAGSEPVGSGAPLERARSFLKADRVLGVAHRGASLDAPENTLAAFRRALEHGIAAIECDVRRTRDGHLVVIHDPTVDRTTDGRGPVGAYSLDALRRLDAGRWFGSEFSGERIPLLEEVLLLARGRAVVQVEIKNDPVPYEGIEAQLLEAIARSRMEADVLVISFDHPSVRTLRALSPRIATGILYAARLVDPEGAAHAAGADALCVHWGYLDRGVVRRAHDAGLGVFVWTVDDADVFTRCVELAVDGIASNDLRLLARLAPRA